MSDGGLKDALEKATFSVLDVAQGREYPRDEITVYMDAASAYLIKHLEAKDADETDAAKSNENAEKITALRQKVKDSALTFHLQGLPTNTTEDIAVAAAAKHKVGEEDGDVDAFNQEVDSTVVALSIKKVVNAKGEVDDHLWTPEEVLTLRGAMPVESWQALFAKVSEVSFASLSFDQIVSADF